MTFEKLVFVKQHANGTLLYSIRLQAPTRYQQTAHCRFEWFSDMLAARLQAASVCQSVCLVVFFLSFDRERNILTNTGWSAVFFCANMRCPFLSRTTTRLYYCGSQWNAKNKKFHPGFYDIMALINISRSKKFAKVQCQLWVNVQKLTWLRCCPENKEKLNVFNIVHFVV